jgi:cation-transporting ATPase I
MIAVAPAAVRGATSVAAQAAGVTLWLPAVAATAVGVDLQRQPSIGSAVAEAAGQVRRKAGRIVPVPPPAGSAAASLGREAASRAGLASRTVSQGTRELLDLRPQRSRRRMWSGGNHAHIEVRGMTGRGPGHRRLAEDVRQRLRQLGGVHWAEVNAVTGRVFVAFDEGRVGVGDLLEAVRDVEEAHGTREENFSWSRPVYPTDSAPVGAAAVELAADCVAFGASVTGRLARLPAAPRGVRAVQALLELEPPLRRTLKRRIGPIGTDVVLALSAAALQGLSQGPAIPAVDGLYRLQLLGEALSRRAVWERREPELCRTAGALPAEAPERTQRPAPRPRGPIEEWNDQLGPGGLAAAGGVFALTRSPAQAADTILAAVPRAARLGRECFAATVGRDLARRGVVPLNAAAWRRLDRVSAVVLDSPLLCTDRPQILAAEAAPDAGIASADLWQAATEALGGRSMRDLAGDGPWDSAGLRLEHDPGGGDPGGGDPGGGDPGGGVEPGGVRLRLHRGDHLLGTVTVSGQLAPLAEAVLEAARSSGARLLLTRHAGAAALLPRVDEVLDADRSLAEEVRRLQADGHGVLAVSGRADPALAAADVGVAVLPERVEGQDPGDTCVCWSADVLCGPGLEDVWRILRATAAARPVSEGAVRLAKAGSTLGGLLALIGQRPAARSHGLAPVYGAALIALARGSVAGFTATREAVPAPVAHVPWHALDPVHVLARLDERRASSGRQSPPARGPAAVARVRSAVAGVAGSSPARGPLRLASAVREELQDPMTPVLAVGAAASAIVGSGIDAILVAGVMAGNAVISGSQRIRAEGALQRLSVEQEVTARRLPHSRADDGARAKAVAGLDSVPLKAVPAATLEPGDIIALRASDVVPADARLLSTVDLEMDESSLTGESAPVQKDVAATPLAPLAERSCMVFEGTTVLAGTAYAVVVATGETTEAGRASRAGGRAAPAAGLQARLGEVTSRALPATLVGGAAVTGLAMLRQLPLRQAVAAGVSVAVAAVPEGLPLVATVAQAAAARRLSRRGVLVRSSRTLEALGRVDVLCFDKTGTLTQGRLAVSRLASCTVDLDQADPAARRLLVAAARACPPVDVEHIRTVPHATDRAVLAAAAELAGQPSGDTDADQGGHADQSGHPAWDWQLGAELPFETTRGYAASFGTDGGEPILVVKGAPEVVLDLCSAAAEDRAGDGERGHGDLGHGDLGHGELGDGERDDGEPGDGEPGGSGRATVALDADRRRAAQEAVQRMAADGLRVLAVAERRDRLPAEPGEVEDLVVEDLVADLTLLGFVGVADTPRPEAAEAVRRMAEEGVRPVMVTGDHPETAAAIARMVSIPADDVVTGTDLDRMTEQERVRRVAQASTFARVSPEQKLRIVEALRAGGHVVAMTGDGTNDAAAIRLADVGIGVAAAGSSSARSAADLVLADAGIGHIHDALLEGRGLWQRVRDAVSILVGGNAGEVAFMVLGTAVAGHAPIGVRQLLLVNVLTDMFPALATAVTPGRGDTGAPGPTSATLGRLLVRAITVRGGATAFGALLAWTIGRYTGLPRRASSMGLAAVVGTQLGQTLLTGWHSPLVVGTALASAAVLVAVVETPGVSHFFGCTPIGPVAWTVVMAASAAGTLVAAAAPRLLPPADAD